MSDYLQVKVAEHQEKVIEEMRKKLADEFGVTVVGQFVTVRWIDGDKLKQVAMVVTDVDGDEEGKTLDELTGKPVWPFGNVFESGDSDVHNS